MHCPSCGFENPEGLKFCKDCGTPLRIPCVQCGFVNQPQAKFCGECGTPLTAQTSASAAAPPPSPLRYTPGYLAEKLLTSHSALEGERKQVTVLFADLKDPMELLADRDPVASRAIGNDLYMEYSSIGETTHLAGGMEQLATPRSIRLIAETLRLAEGFIQIIPLGAVSVKGLAVPVEVFEQVDASSIRRGLQATAARGLTRIVGGEAEALAATLNDTHRLGQVSLFRSTYLYLVGAYDQAITPAQRARALATTGGDTILLARMNNHLGIAYEVQGDYRRAIDCFEPSVASLKGDLRYERFGRSLLFPVNFPSNHAACHTELGKFPEGCAIGEEGLRIAEVVNHPDSLMIAYFGIGLLFLRQGNLYRALPLLKRAMGTCHDTDLRTNFPRMAAALGAAWEKTFDALI